jgi:hypothetical protein
MNTLNRILIVLLAFITWILCLIFVIVPPVLSGVGNQMEALALTLETQPGWLRVVAGGFFALVGLAIFVLILALQFRRPRARTVRVEKVGGGEVEVSLKTIADRVAFDIDQLPGVINVRPRVTSHRSGVEVEVMVDAAGEKEVPEQAARIIEVVRQAVEERVGVKLAKPPKVRLQAAPVPVTTMRLHQQEEPVEPVKSVEPAEPQGPIVEG